MTNIERLIERLYESKPDKEEYDMKKIINPWKDMVLIMEGSSMNAILFVD